MALIMIIDYQRLKDPYTGLLYGSAVCQSHLLTTSCSQESDCMDKFGMFFCDALWSLLGIGRLCL